MGRRRSFPCRTDDTCSCDEQCNDCYRVDYSWTFWCNGNQITYTGSALIYDYEIVCYDDANVVAAASEDGRVVKLEYPGGCDVFAGTQPFIRIDCNQVLSTIVFSGPDGPDVVQWDGAFCCGDSPGTVTGDGFSLYSVTVSKNNDDTCDCDGYTSVPP